MDTEYLWWSASSYCVGDFAYQVCAVKAVEEGWFVIVHDNRPRFLESLWKPPLVYRHLNASRLSWAMRTYLKIT